MHVGLILFKEPALNRGQDDLSRHFGLACRSLRRLQLQTKGGNRRVMEQIFHDQLVPRLQKTGRYLQGLDRIAAERKEIVHRADLIHAQHRLPDRRKCLLGRSTRRRVCSLGTNASFRYRQRFTVDLPVRRKRHLIQAHDARRHHMGRQRGVQMGHKPFKIEAGIRYDIPAQIFLLPLVRPVDDKCLTHAGKIFHGRFNLTKLDPIAANFHLVVDPADEVHVAVRHPARQVARPVQPLPSGERAVYEFLRRQIRAVQVTAGHSRSADNQLAQHPDRHRLQIRIHDVELGVQPRFPDRHAARLRQLLQRLVIEAGVNRRFRYTVAVNNTELRAEALLQGAVIRYAARIRACDQQLHRAEVQTLGMHMLHERHDQRRSRFEHRHGVVANPAVEAGWINPVVLRHDDHGAAVVQRPRNVADEHVEREAGELQQPDRELIQAVFPPVARRRVHQAAVLDHHALRLARRTGGVDDVSQIARLVHIRRIRCEIRR
ncbi:hypothetical protein D3C74_222350 [compost metagenome]